jgi:hypothetical protein
VTDEGLVLLGVKPVAKFRIKRSLPPPYTAMKRGIGWMEIRTIRPELKVSAREIPDTSTSTNWQQLKST